MRGNSLRHRLAAAELLEQTAQDRLDRIEHILLRDEAHLEVELVEFARRAVGAGVLVAEAGRDLEITVEARDHDQLLELLRRLRQRIELAGMHAARHQIIARAFGRGRGEDRRLELEEAGIAHALAQRPDDVLPLHDIGVQRFAPEIEEAISEPRVLRIVRLAEHRQRQLLGFGQHIEALDPDLDRAGRQVGIDRLGRAGDHLAVDAHHPFGLQPLRLLEGRRMRVGHGLRQAVMVAEIDEQQPAVIAQSMHPARQSDGLADILLAQRAATMGAIVVHG